MWMTHTNREVYMPLTGILFQGKTGAADKPGKGSRPLNPKCGISLAISLIYPCEPTIYQLCFPYIMTASDESFLSNPTESSYLIHRTPIIQANSGPIQPNDCLVHILGQYARQLHHGNLQ